MASSIDTAIPPFGNPTTAGVRNNFSAAKNEIEHLQTAHFIRVQHVSESIEVFQQCAVSNVPQVIEFNQELFNNGSVFTFDDPNNEIVIGETGWYGAMISYHVVRKVATGAVDFHIHSQLKTPSGSFTNFPGSLRSVTMPGSVANEKYFHTVAFISQITVAGTRLRWMQTTSDATKEVGIVTYPAAGSLPGAAGVSLSVWRIGE